MAQKSIDEAKDAHKIVRKEAAMAFIHNVPRPRSNISGKRAINLTLSADILAAAKALNINISQVCDAHLREVVQREQERRWRLEHADFIAAYNTTVETEACLSMSGNPSSGLF